MARRQDGTYFENSSCDMVCPCTTSGLTMPADQDRCRVVLAFHVDHGEVDGLDVSDKTVVVVADTPPAMADGNWRLGVIMDAAASPEQAAGLAPLIGEMLGIESALIDYVDEGRRHSLKVGDFMDIQIEDFVPPQPLPDSAVEMLTGGVPPGELHPDCR